MAIKVKQAINFETGDHFTCVLDTESCLPVEPIQRYLNYSNRRRLAPNTIKAYAYRLVDYWDYLREEGLSWQSVNLSDLADFAGWYLMGGSVIPISAEAQEVTAARAPRTVNQAITVVQSFYNFHEAEGRVEHKPFSQVTYRKGHWGGFLRGIVKAGPEYQKRIKLKEPKKFPGCLTNGEIKRLIAACTTNRDVVILLLLRYTGLRRGELLGLHLEDILWQQRHIKVVRRINPNGAWAKGCEREVPILENTDDVLAAIEHYLNYEYPLEAEQLGHGMLFANLDSGYRGQPMTADRVSKMIDSLYAKTGIEAYPHLFRHTFATRMLQAGYSENYVKQLLGHRLISTTQDIYSHVLEERDIYTLLMNDEDE